MITQNIYKIDLSWKCSTWKKSSLALLKSFCQSAIVATRLEWKSNQILSIQFVESTKMAEINESFVGHLGDTDVITFDYRTDENFNAIENIDFFNEDDVCGEIFICPEVAFRQSNRRKNRYYSREVALYIVHGLLHLRGENDINPLDRKKMRAAERCVMKKLEKEFDFRKIFPINNEK